MKEQQEEEDRGESDVFHLCSPVDVDDDADFEFAAAASDDEAISRAAVSSFPLFGRDRSPVKDELRQTTISDHVAALTPDPVSSSDPRELDETSYCVWSPAVSADHAPPRRRRSASVGSMETMRWSLRDVIFGRSGSDGHDPSRFLVPPPLPPQHAKKERMKSVKVTEMDVTTAHRLFYAKRPADGEVTGGRRSYLSYRPEMVGLFANPANHFQY